MAMQFEHALLLMVLAGALGTVLGGALSTGLVGLVKQLWRGVSLRRTDRPVDTPVLRTTTTTTQAQAAQAAIRKAKATAREQARHAQQAQPALPYAADLLLVDDSAVARAKLRKLFEPAGYQVHLAKDGVEALELLRRGRYALMVTDLEMPQMDGVELIRSCKARADTAHMPILAVTGHDHLRAKFNECHGVQGVHRKPWVDDILLSHVAALVPQRMPQRSPQRLPQGLPQRAPSADHLQTRAALVD
jgi:CheY-like chemotaxis protein